MQGTTTTSVFKLWLCLGALQGHSLAGRAERQLDRVADFGQRLGKPAAEGDIDDGDLEIRYDLPRSGPELALSRPTQRPPAGQWSRLAPREPLHWTKRSPDGSALVYVVAPVSQRIIPLDGDKVAQGFRSFVPLADSYQLGLQRQLPAAAARSTALVGPTGGLADQCRMARASVELTRDEVDKISGKLLRNCRGWVQLNRCEGSCGSSSEPSIRSLTGFRKNCACCNEATFRRVRVRLDDCRRPDKDGEDNNEDDKVSSQPSGSIELEVDEPVGCKCRKCGGDNDHDHDNGL